MKNEYHPFLHENSGGEMGFLFWHRKPYDVQGTEALFFRKVKENMFFCVFLLYLTQIIE